MERKAFLLEIYGYPHPQNFYVLVCYRSGGVGEGDVCGLPVFIGWRINLYDSFISTTFTG